MKTTIDIPEHELQEAIQHTGAATKREAVVTAIADFNRRRRLARIVESFGSFEHFLSPRALEALREQG